MRTTGFAVACAFGALALSSSVLAQTAGCSSKKADAAGTAVDHIFTWHDFAQYRRDYAACDEGEMEEGSAAFVVHTLATNWTSLPALQHEITADPALAPFLFRHIDATTDGSDLRAVERHAETQCPDGAAKLCRLIARGAHRALTER